MAAINKHDNYPTITFENSHSFEKWLAKNHAKEEGVWVKIAKAGTGIDSVTYHEGVEVALCYGWIDGLRRPLDETYFTQKFTPRRANSIWSVINKQKVAILISQGRMQDAGLAAIEMAKQNGQWDRAYESQNTITIPADLQKALNKNRKAKSFFTKLTSQNRYAILFRIGKVKKPETRTRKIAEYVEMLQRHETIYPQ